MDDQVQGPSREFKIGSEAAQPVLARIAIHALRLDELLPGTGRLRNIKALRRRRFDGARQQSSYVFTLSHVAEMLGEDKERPFDVAEEMDTEDGQL
jgi:hypothetical protein